MKNKLYYILAFLYILIFGFILYINGGCLWNASCQSRRDRGRTDA